MELQEVVRKLPPFQWATDYEESSCTKIWLDASESEKEKTIGVVMFKPDQEEGDKWRYAWADVPENLTQSLEACRKLFCNKK